MKELSKVEGRQESGFTLVELAVVMVIIGLLIGGILKGQELIKNAQVTATIAQIKGMEAAITTFRDKYGQLPGDMTSPVARLRDCAGVCATVGDGNGRIATGNAPSSVTIAVAGESAGAWAHLAAAGLIQGVEVNGAEVFGEGMPSAKVGGGFRIGFDADGAIVGTINTLRPGHVIVLSNDPTGTVTATDTIVPASSAAQMDRKMDDGLPSSGSVQADGDNALCANAALYREAEDGPCQMGIEIQG